MNLEDLKRTTDHLLAFDIDSSPTWRPTEDELGTEGRLEGIVNFMRWYRGAERSCKEADWLRRLRRSFVVKMAIGEDEGVKDELKVVPLDHFAQSTRDLPMDEYLQRVKEENFTMEELITVGMLRALQYFEAKKVNSNIFELTEELLQEAHVQLLKGPTPNRLSHQLGHWATCERRATSDGRVHFYTKPENIAKEHDMLMVHLYNCLLYLKEAQLDDLEQLKLIIKTTAYFITKWLNIHPFGDGNGRLARLAASALIRSIGSTPFEVPIFNVFSPSTRDDYLKALIFADDDDGTPGQFAALIVDSLHDTWVTFKKYVDDDDFSANHQMLFKAPTD